MNRTTQAPPPLPDIKDAKMDPEDARVVEADVKRTRYVFWGAAVCGAVDNGACLD